MVFKVTRMVYDNGTIFYDEKYIPNFDDAISNILDIFCAGIGQSIIGSWCQHRPTHKIIIDRTKYYCYDMYDLQGVYCNMVIVPEAKEAVNEELRYDDEGFAEKHELIKAVVEEYGAYCHI